MSGISMTALTTSVRMEEFVWMASILTTAAAPLSGPVGAGHVADETLSKVGIVFMLLQGA